MDYLNSCNEEQKQAILHGTGPAMILAGPGSGKTFVITRRIKYLIEVLKVSPKEIAVITFTKAAAIEMKERTLFVCKEASQTAFGTFHSFFYQILRSYSPYSNFTIITEQEKNQILKQILFTIYSDVHLINQKIPSLKNDISYYLNTNSIPDECDTSEFNLVYKKYRAECLRRKKFDFDLILSECLNLLKTNEMVRSRWQLYFKYYLVDEYQDTNDIQFQIMNILTKKYKNIFVVGDDDQSIYRFRGADPQIMFRFLQVYPDSVQITLKENFRSKKMILDFASQSISNNTLRFQKQLYCHDQEQGEVFFLNAKDRGEEVDLLIESILKRKREGVKETDLCILCRTANLFPYLGMKLKKAGILFENPKEIKHFCEEEAVKDIFSYLRYVFLGRKRKDLFQVLNRPERCLSRDFFERDPVDLTIIRQKYENNWNVSTKREENTIEYGDKEENEVLSALHKLEKDVTMLESLDSYGSVCYILYGMGYETYLLSGKNALERERQKEILEALKLQAKMYTDTRQWIDAMENMQTDEASSSKNLEKEQQGIHLLTYHASKGLEFQHVYLPFLNEYIVPHKKALTEEEIEEERRMFYVAMTRAKESLTLSFAENKGNKPSLFVEELRKFDKNP